MQQHERPANSLRRMLAIITVVVAVLAVTSAGALIFATNAIRQKTTDAATAVESIRLIEEAEISLLLHVRAADSVVKRSFASELRGLLDAAEDHVAGPVTGRLLDDARSRVEYYLRVAHDSNDAAEIARAETLAFGALERLVEATLDKTRRAHAEAITWDRVTNLVGIGLGIEIVALTAMLVIWTRRRLIRPLFALADSLKRFGAGDRSVRAAERGPLELCEMSQRFNEMADAIATQRDAQIAFLGGVAHDLRTPLAAMRLAVDVLQHSEPLPQEPQLRNLIALIARQTTHLDRMAGDFLDMSRIEAGKLDLRIAEHDARALVTSVVQLFETTARGRLEVALPAAPVVVACDDVRIGQALTNLVSNAIKYSPPTRTVHIAVEARIDEAVIEVIDHGEGISTEDHRTLFEPFRRAGRQDKTGTGLGLFNVKRLVEAHGGRVEVESTPARGSTFRVCLPLAHPATPASAN